MARIDLSDSGLSAIIKLAEGNIGAATALAEVSAVCNSVDPDNLLGVIGILCSLDDMQVYGPRIWMLYKDVCGQNPNLVVMLLRARQLGFLHPGKLDFAIDNYGKGIDLEDLGKKVKEYLPNFNLDYKA